MRDRLAIGILSGVALLFMAWLAWSQRERILPGHNDFVAFYAGGRLAGRIETYNPEKIRQVQVERVGVTSQAWRFIRLPYHAAVFWPLAQLPYATAYGIWQFLSLGALAGFVALWRPPGASLTLLFTLLSLPVMAGLMNGQDVSFLLLWIALATRLVRQERPFWAGLVLALCAAKYHLFLLLPLLIVGQKAWRLGWGLACGGGVLAAVSFAVAGPRWPAEYLEVLRDPAIHPQAGNMPNLHGLFASWHGAGGAEWVVAALVAVVVWRLARRCSFDGALAAVLTGSLLVSYHAYLPDCSILLPAALVALSSASSPWLRGTALALLTPVVYFVLLAPSALAALVPALILGALLLMAWEVRFAARGALDQPPSG